MFQIRFLGRVAACLFMAGALFLSPACGGGGGGSTPTPAATAPVISTQPASQFITEGGSVSLSVAATGNGTLTYQWKKGGVDLTGKTSASLTLNPVTLADAGSYTVLVTNTLNGTSQATLSSAAVLTVNPAATVPVIGTQPASQSITEGGSVSFSVAATGNGTLTYQWKKGGVDLTGKTSASLTLNPVALADAGSYTVLVTNTLNGTSQASLSSAAVLTVTAPAATHFSVTGFASPTTAGTSHSFKVTALDASNNPVPGYAGTVHFTSTDVAATLPADYSFTGPDSGTHTFTATLKTAGAQSLTATDTVTGSITGAQAISVHAPAATHFSVTGFASPTNAGNSHSFTVTALDASNNPVPGYAGTIHFTSTDAAATLPADYSFTGADSGTHTFTATLKTAGAQSLTATDTVTGSITGTQAISVSPAAASHFSMTGFPSPTTPGVSHSFTVTALDAFGNTAAGYAGTVHFSSSDAAATLPADYVFPVADGGVHAFSATLQTAGSQTLTATDTATAALTGSHSPITVNTAAPVIQTQPQSRSVIAPDGATFTVAATGTGTLTYQWRKNGTDLPGETGASLTVDSTDLQEISATFSVVVKDAGGASTTSENATLTVMAPEPTYAGDPAAVPSRPLTVLPSYQVGTAFPHGAFRVGYDEALKNPAWTAYANFKFTTAFANGTRTFLADDRLAEPQVTDGDYSGSGWTRGHQVMMSDLAYRYGSQAGTDTCRLSNVAPQDADHNNNFWNHLEQVVGGSSPGSTWTPGLADTFNRIWIYTGPTFEADAALLPGAVAPVRIPSGFWKVVVRETAPGQPKVVAVLTPNKAGLAMTEAEIQKYTTSVARIEALTGLDLFPTPASPLPATFKTAVDVRGWGSSFEVVGKPNVHMVAPSWDVTTPVGTTLTFQGDATSPNSSIASTTWTFGDGQTANGSTASHSYAAGGTYSVTFTATDGLGVSNAITRVVTVTGGNQAPTVTGLPASEVTAVDTAKDLAFTVSDDAAPLAVTFTASSSNQSIVPDSALSFTGTMANPVLHIVPATGATGTVTLTVRVTDGDLATTTKTLTFAVGVAAPPTPLSEAFTWAGTGSAGYATADYTLASGSWHFVTTLSSTTDPNDAKNGGQGLRMKAVANSAVWMNFDFGSASTQANSVSVAYGVYLTDANNGKTATFSLYSSQDQGGTWTKVGSSVTASSNSLNTATFSGLNLTGPVRFKLAVDGTPTARLCLDDFLIQ